MGRGQCVTRTRCSGEVRGTHRAIRLGMNNTTHRCPSCGSRNAQDNGYTGADLTLLCVAPVVLGAEDSFGNTREEAIRAGYLDENAEHICGMQWEPNQ